MIRQCTEDTVIPTDDTKSGFGKNGHFVPAGTYINMSFVGLHYNRKFSWISAVAALTRNSEVLA